MTVHQFRRPSILRWVPQAAIVLVVASLYGMGYLNFLESELADARFKLLERSPSNGLVLVEIDAKSLQELPVWPWPRSFHAAIIDRLIAANAGRIAIDLDFSAHSSQQEDLALETALAAAEGRVVLPAFMQAESGRAGRAEVVLSAPLPALARHVTLASVNVVPEADGRVRSASPNVTWGASSLPAFFAVLFGDSNPAPETFYIDYGIQPSAITRVSFIDLLTGSFEHELFAGKHVLIGATAGQLSDEIPVPVYGVLPGIMVQALAYESLAAGRTLQRVTLAPILIVALLIVLVLGPKFLGWSWRRGLLVLAAVWLASFGLSIAVQAVSPIILEITPWLLTLASAYFFALTQRLDQQDLRLLAQSLTIRRKNAFMSQVVEKSFDGILTFDETGTIQTLNPAAALIFGSNAEATVGGDLRKILYPVMSANLAAGAIDFRQLQGGPHEFAARRQDGECRTVQIVVSQMEQDRETLSIAQIRDVSEQKQQENSLRRAVEQAETANRSKTEFLANMSHELRTPLNAIIGFSEMFVEEVLGPLGAPRYREYAKDIRASGKHLLDIINDVLDVSKIEAGEHKLNCEQFDIETTIQVSLRLVDKRAQDSKHRLSVEIPDNLPELYADRRALKQVLLNLLSNAIKFTPEGGTISVRARMAEDQRLTIDIADSGIGIAAEDVQKALAFFGQVDGDLTRKYEGTGIGLTLAQRLMELHGGTLSLESAVGEGTTVTICFPAERVQQPNQLPVANSAVA
jgi:PAS domain S-box-containing protein